MSVKSKIKNQKSKIKNSGVAVLAAALLLIGESGGGLRLDVAGAAKVDGKYGVLVKGKLIPEVVKRGELEIDRKSVV